DTAAPALVREMRGLWIATVANIDWPSRSALSAEQQRAELVDILTRAATTGINTIVLHVRPAGDALYASTLEPWGSMLSGTQGVGPGYDPLAFAIDEAHARGMELHAWINPFRAGNTADTLKLASPHLFRTRRDLVRVYAGNIWMDPGEPEVQDHSMRVIADIVSRYDIDGIHADDYFYPYQVVDNANRVIPFPDDATYSRYGAGLSRDDWRRANIDRFVERMYREVHAIKPTIKVGISPFGIWRPGFPAGVNGLDAYATIYADSRKWLQQGWVDYLAPQLYWAIAAPQQSYPALLDWWLSQNPAGRHVWPGLAAYRVNDGTASAFSSQEIPDQIRATRARPAASGHLLYNTSWTLKRNGGALATTLQGELYKTAAVVPAVPWLDASPPPTPTISVSGNSLQINPAAGEEARWWVVRMSAASGWTTRVIFGAVRSIALDSTVGRVLVQAMDRAGNVSAAAEWRK
ncbi:MAG TPA: family 10 glycosylhydrolase, partial [Gemmatimonadaceae bacterium]|nr:family 10 glycosylhydrolase [Gemmatimonadaceae bacterium]